MRSRPPNHLPCTINLNSVFSTRTSHTSKGFFPPLKFQWPHSDVFEGDKQAGLPHTAWGPCNALLSTCDALPCCLWTTGSPLTHASQRWDGNADSQMLEAFHQLSVWTLFVPIWCKRGNIHYYSSFNDFNCWHLKSQAVIRSDFWEDWQTKHRPIANDYFAAKLRRWWSTATSPQKTS